MKRHLYLISLILICSCQFKKEDRFVQQDKSLEPILDHLANPSGFNDLDQYIDWNHIYYVIANQTDYDKEYISNIVSSFKEGFSTKISEIQITGSRELLYRKVKTYSDSSTFHLLVEISSGNEFDFFDLEIDTVNNQVKNIFVYSIGEKLTDIVKDQLVVGSSKLKEERTWFLLANEAFNNDDYEEAWDYITMIPYGSKFNFPFRTLIVQLSENDPELIKDLIDELSEMEFASSYLDFISLRAGIINKDPELIFESIEGLNDKLSGSILLNLFKGYAFELQNETYKALQEYDNVIKAAPESLVGYLSKIELYIANGEDLKALELMKVCDDNFNLSIDQWRSFLENKDDFLNNKYKFN